MLLIPAIDLQGGRCVRLRQGRFDEATVFAEDPVAQATDWVRQGARRLHLVDLDGAQEGTPQNREAIAAIARAHPSLPLQVGGGIRSRTTIAEYLAAGVDSVIVGTRAIQEPDWADAMIQAFPGRLWIGLDARDGRLAVAGWVEDSEYEVIATARRFDGPGIAGFVFTDIQRDGMMAGYDIEGTAALARAVRRPVLASGGVSQRVDVQRLAAAEPLGVTGAIVGRALYEGRLELAEAQAWLDANASSEPDAGAPEAM